MSAAATMTPMNLLLLHATQEVEQCASLLRDARGYNITRLADSDALPLALKHGSSSTLLVSSRGFGHPADLRDLLYQCHDHALSVVLVIDHLAELTGLDHTSISAVADFAIRPVAPELLAQRVAMVIDRHPMSQSAIAADLELTRALTSRVINAQEAERHFLSRELHDGVGQIMLVHYMEAEWLAQELNEYITKYAKALPEH